MFGFGNKKAKLERKYQKKLVEALQAQRNGNIALFSELSAQADKILKEIEKLEKEE